MAGTPTGPVPMQLMALMAMANPSMLASMAASQGMRPPKIDAAPQGPGGVTMTPAGGPPIKPPAPQANPTPAPAEANVVKEAAAQPALPPATLGQSMFPGGNTPGFSSVEARGGAGMELGESEIPGGMDPRMLAALQGVQVPNYPLPAPPGAPRGGGAFNPGVLQLIEQLSQGGRTKGPSLGALM